MKTLKTVLVTIALLLVLGLVFAFSGLYDVSARTPHWGITQWFLHVARERSVEFHKSEINLPPASEEMLQNGFSHYHSMCRRCHGAPGYPPKEFALGLYPKPPALPSHHERGSSTYYWIVANGFKMTGMPSFADTHDRKEIMDIVAFVQKLGQYNIDEYEDLVERNNSESHGHDAGHDDDGHGHNHE